MLKEAREVSERQRLQHLKRGRRNWNIAKGPEGLDHMFRQPDEQPLAAQEFDSTMWTELTRGNTIFTQEETKTTSPDQEPSSGQDIFKDYAA